MTESIYIAGPMTGLPDSNYPAFFEAEERLGSTGYYVVNPARNFYAEQDLPRATYMQLAMRQVTRAAVVVLLDGWENSPGARLEVMLANDLGIPCVPLECVLAPHWSDECAVFLQGHLDVTVTCGGKDQDMNIRNVIKKTLLIRDDLYAHDCDKCGVGNAWCECHFSTPEEVKDAVKAAAEEFEDVTPSATAALVTIREAVLDEAKRLTMGERDAQYGPPTQDFQRTADALTALGYGLARDGVWQALSAHDIAVIMSVVKLSRIIESPIKRDSWVDLAGYAACGAESAEEGIW